MAATYNDLSVDSTSPQLPHVAFDPIHIRQMLQKQMQATTNRLGDQLSLSVGDFDGRFASQLTPKIISRGNSNGFLYHLVGLSRGGDLSVAAP